MSKTPSGAQSGNRCDNSRSDIQRERGPRTSPSYQLSSWFYTIEGLKTLAEYGSSSAHWKLDELGIEHKFFHINPLRNKNFLRYALKGAEDGNQFLRFLLSFFGHSLNEMSDSADYSARGVKRLLSKIRIPPDAVTYCIIITDEENNEFVNDYVGVFLDTLPNLYPCHLPYVRSKSNQQSIRPKSAILTGAMEYRQFAEDLFLVTIRRRTMHRKTPVYVEEVWPLTGEYVRTFRNLHLENPKKHRAVQSLLLDGLQSGRRVGPGRPINSYKLSYEYFCTNAIGYYRQYKDQFGTPPRQVDVAEGIGISLSTFSNYMKDYSFNWEDIKSSAELLPE